MNHIGDYNNMVMADEWKSIIDSLRAENAQLKAELARCQQDLKDAAGELVVTMPEPGTDMAKLLSANVLLRQREARLMEALQSIKKIRFLLGNDPKLNPAYEMGDIASKPIEEAGT